MNKKYLFFFFLFLLFISACSSKSSEKKVIDITKDSSEVSADDSSFNVRENAQICTKDGKPIIRKFATTWCPHCRWIKETYTNVVQEYVDRGEIVAYLWNLDIEDDALTVEKEGAIPLTEIAIHADFNPDRGIPTFVFGCKYYRVGNAFEQQNDLAAEESEFRKIIERVIEETKK